MKLPRIRLPRWVKVLVVLGALVTVVFGVPLWVWLTVDIAPPDDSDLVLAWPSVAPEDNGFELVNWGQDDLKALDDSLDSDGFDELWDPVQGRALVASAAPYVEQFEASLARFDFYLPEEIARGGPRTFCWCWEDVARRIRYSARLALDDGRIDDALEDALRLVEFGRRAQCSGGGFLTYLTGLSVQGTGIVLFHDLVLRVSLSPPALLQYRRRFAECEPADDNLEHALRAHYTQSVHLLGETVRELEEGSRSELGAPFLDELYCPNEARHVYAEQIRGLIRAASIPRLERPGFKRLCTSVKIVGVELELPFRNRVGCEAADQLSAYLEDLLDPRDRTHTAYRLTLALVALRAYHAEHSDLPDSLEDLVPHHLDAVPVDPYDGKPLRYSKATRRVWSIGADGKDKGGYVPKDDEGAPLYKGREPTIHLDFAAE